MTPEAVEAALARARAAGETLRARPARETHDALARALDAFGDPESPARRELARELPKATGFSPQTVEKGLALALAPLRGDALRAVVERDLAGADHVAGFPTTAMLLAGALPTPTLTALLWPLALRSGVVVKPASADPLTPRVVARAFAEADSGLGACIEIADLPGEDAACADALLRADCVVATGSDATIAAVAARVAPPRRLVTYGHRVSLAALGPAALAPDAVAEVAARCALDVALWDQLGCLSPVCVFAVSEDAAAVDRLADALAEALADAEQRWPRGRVPTHAHAALRRERGEAELRAAEGGRARVLGGDTVAWTVVREADAVLRPAPLYRFVRVHRVPDAAALCDALAPWGPWLAGVAIEGFADDQAVAARVLALGASRACRPGALQAPPLSWHHDGRSPLAPLARFGDAEP